MRIIHTADWHLNDRLGRIDRTQDLRAAVQRVADYCLSERADVLIVAGDLFSELARLDAWRESIRHLQSTFGEFLAKGGTILTLTGNHDNENFCRTLEYAMALAAPIPNDRSQPATPGRFYLATEANLLHLPDRRNDQLVQFLLMPYPTPARYLHGSALSEYKTAEERNQSLNRAFTEELRKLQRGPCYHPNRPTVLAAHVHVRGSEIIPLFRLSEEQDVIFDDQLIPDQIAYVALGHIHKAHCIGQRQHVRYSGSIERMDLGEQHDDKSIVRVDLNRDGGVDEIVTLPLPASRIYELEISNPTEQIPQFRKKYADARDDLVKLRIRYQAGENLEWVLRELDDIFPRWYDRDWCEMGQLDGALVAEVDHSNRSFEETVREYVSAELINHSEADRTAIMERLEKLFGTE
jgi:exonuclease SbcD